MENKTNKQNNSKPKQGLAEAMVALGLILLCAVLIILIRLDDSSAEPLENGVLEDSVSVSESTPTTTELYPLSIDGTDVPLEFTDEVTLSRLYTASGYFPEDGTDEQVDNVLAAAFTNTSEKTLEYMTVTLTVNGENYDFSLTTVPPGKSVYAFNTERKTAPEGVQSVEYNVIHCLFFAEEPDIMPDTFEYTCQTGTVVVKNISDKDIDKDIFVYYKSTAEGGYLGGITYRFRISGGLKAGEVYNAYAPHAYSHMTEIMFADYDT